MASKLSPLERTLSLMITPKDVRAIIQQCKNQVKAPDLPTPEEYVTFAIVYDRALHDVTYNLNRFTEPTSLEEMIKTWAAIINGKYGYRYVPVHFKDSTNFALHPDLIPRAMTQYCEAFAELRFETPDVAYEEFENIHPFMDGNGRVGHLLWASYNKLRGNGWPTAMPPEVNF